MAKKRGSGEGTVFKRNDGRWVGRLSLKFDASGKRLQKTVYGKTQSEVNQKLDAASINPGSAKRIEQSGEASQAVVQSDPGS